MSYSLVRHKKISPKKWTAPKSLDKLKINYYKNEVDIVSDSFYLSSILFFRYCNSKCIVLFHF